MKLRIAPALRALHPLLTFVLVLLGGSPVRAEPISLLLSVPFQPLGTILDSSVPRVFQSAPDGDVIENGAFRITYSVQRSPLQVQFSSRHFTGSTVVTYSVEGCAVVLGACPSLGSCAGAGTVDFGGDVTPSDDGALHVGFTSVSVHPAACTIMRHNAVPAIASKVESRFRDELARGGASFEAQPFFQGPVNRVWTAASAPIQVSISSAATLQFRPQSIWLEDVTIYDASAQAALHLGVAHELDLDGAGHGSSSPVLGRASGGSGRRPFSLIVPASQIDSRVQAAVSSAGATFSARTSVDERGVSLALSFPSGGTGVAGFAPRIDGESLILAFTKLSVDGVTDEEQDAAGRLFRAALSTIAVLPERLRAYASMAESNSVLVLSCRYRLNLDVGSRYFDARATTSGIEVQLSRAETKLVDSCAAPEFDPTAPPRWPNPIVCQPDCI